jgi:hypothetical protein
VNLGKGSNRLEQGKVHPERPLPVTRQWDPCERCETRRPSRAHATTGGTVNARSGYGKGAEKSEDAYSGQ